MQITNLKVNHISNPVGFHLSPLVFSYVVAESTGKKQAAARILVARDAAMTDICYDTGLREDIDSLAYEADFTPDPASRYYWKVFVTADDGDIGESEAAYFETAKDAGDIKGSFLIARKSLGVKSENVDGTYWWVWPDDKEPDEVNREKSEELMRNERIRD